jgi:DNA-nicking Smr family endonuclease
MRRRPGQRSSSGARDDGRSAPSGFDHQPFRKLARLLGENGRRATASPAPPVVEKPPPPPPDPEPSDEELFRREMANVRPVPEKWRAHVPVLPPQNDRPITDPDAEVLAELSELVTGGGSFDIANTTEFVEGAVVGLDPRVVRQLREGRFAYQSHVDLHGMTAQEARVAVDRFLTDAHRNGQRCVLIVHGRGLNSKDQVPVLKNRLSTWLARGAWARMVLAFTSARPCDGGAGALYVLLRRDRKAKRPILVTRGARW